MSKNTRQLHDYCDEYWQYILLHNPTYATYTGDHRYDDRLEDLSEEELASQARYFEQLLLKAELIDEKNLNGEDRSTYSLLQRSLNNHIRSHILGTHYLPLDHMQGPHIDFPQIIEFHPFETTDDFSRYISRLKAFPRQIDQVIELLSKGVELKITAFMNVIVHVTEQVGSLAGIAHKESPLYLPVTKMGDRFSDADIKTISGAVRDALATSVGPAYQKLNTYLKNEYLDNCRKEAGIWSLPDGDDLYRFYVEYHTSTDLSPAEIHEIGVSEVSRVSGEIQTIMEKRGFSGNIRAFAASLKENRDLYPKTAQEILDAYRDILSHMDTELPRFFGRLPRATYAVKQIEEYREKAAPAAYYYPPPRDFSRPGYFYANTYNPEERPTYEMEALSYHEAVPGHHLQIAIMQELEDIPEFRRHEGSTAFIEGWALYAENLAQEMGFYHDDLSVYGRLTFELWRAVRLVVDTGLHYFKWNREQAVRYCRDNTGLEDHEIGVEVDRYIAMPGQALAYKIGELKILELREEAKREMGTEFSIADFHDRLLEHGALPLSILMTVIRNWIEDS
jgi:uncharacterized protein (DUF885 family)